MDLSVVIPIYNEEESIPRLLPEIHKALAPTGLRYEIVCVDDGSRDKSFQVLAEAAKTDPALVVVRFRRNFGQTAAMQAGLDEARGANIAFLDADLQNDPADIPAMLQKLDEGHDMVAGWRANRQDTFVNRKLPSMIANRIISSTTKVRLHDYGCTLKVMRADLAKTLNLYGEMHRFIPAIADWAGSSIIEMPVNHRARQFGVSKYGIGRTVRVVLDLLVVRFMQSYVTKPMQVFGLGGMASGALGVLILLWLTLSKLIWGTPLADRPLLLLGVLLVVVGVQLVSMGLVADLLARTYHEAQGKRPFHVRTRIVGPGAGGAVEEGEA
ncbi:MAG: glycosyltransferase family 2 protein [Myxococcales bacterium]|nr:glycosyltransferase family 2 protein [Myxococcales bacterium]